MAKKFDFGAFLETDDEVEVVEKKKKTTTKTSRKKPTTSKTSKKTDKPVEVKEVKVEPVDEEPKKPGRFIVIEKFSAGLDNGTTHLVDCNRNCGRSVEVAKEAIGGTCHVCVQRMVKPPKKPTPPKKPSTTDWKVLRARKRKREAKRLEEQRKLAASYKKKKAVKNGTKKNVKKK